MQEPNGVFTPVRKIRAAIFFPIVSAMQENQIIQFYPPAML